LVTGENIKLANARVDASGRAGGGKVLIGGDWRGANPNTSLINNPSAKLESFEIPTATTVSVDAGTTINGPRPETATAARSSCGPTARPPSPERSLPAAARAAAMVDSSRSRATNF